MNNKENLFDLFIKNFFTILFYYAGLFAILQLFCYLFIEHKWLFTQDAFLNWDAKHYFFISQHGYEGFRLAFFPFFPFLWRLTGQGVVLITVINAIIYLSSFSYLSAHLQVKKLPELLLLASIPCLMFMFIPYTESLFFLFSTMLLVGLKRNIPALVCCGILLCGITRPTATVFIPAILLTIYIASEEKKKKIQMIVLYSLFAIAGLGITLLIQHSYTGQWFAFFEAQKGWGNELRIPTFPLSSWAGGKIVRLDGSALLVGLFSLGYLARILFLKEYKKRKIEGDFFFSLSYLAIISLLILFFRGGSLFSLNRFVFATPFFISVLFSFFKNYQFSFKEIGLFILLSNLFWLLFGSYVHIQYFLKFELLSIYFALFFLLNNSYSYVKKTSVYLILLINSALLMYFYYRFLTNDWVG